MPILNFRANESSEIDGKQISSSEVLEIAGPRFPAFLIRPNDQPNEHESIQGSVLVDTGARVTCFDVSIAERIGLPVVDSGSMSSATHSNHIVPIYAGTIALPDSGLTLKCNRAYGVSLEEFGIVGLIGRDALTNAIFIYNGSDGSYSLAL
ncbi:MAG: hypothetical protein OXC80_09390 [Gammaproteobacteria bacterium]|nr:hypothetical protein [Gammaproteobacteria bacterium]